MTCTFPHCDCVRDNPPLCKKSSIQAIYPTKAGFGATQRLYTETELQAAIAAAMMRAVKPLEWVDIRNNSWRADFGYEICWNGGDEYRIRQNGKVLLKAINGLSRARDWVQRTHAARILSALSIPTDATAALEAMLAEAEQRGFDRAKEQIACVIESRPAFWAGRASAAIRAMKDKPPLRDPVNQVIAGYDQGGAA